MQTRYFLGVDGGQSGTTALIGDESGAVVGHGAAGPCNHVAAPEGRAKLTAAVTESVGQACAKAGLSAQTVFTGACLGFSGGPADKEEIVRSFLSADHMLVTTDAWIALAGAMGGGSGIIVISGTGSMALGRNGERTARAGGWGYVFGDEGGGFDITRQALRAALRFEEGWGDARGLHRKLLQETGAADANDLLHRMYTPEFHRPRIAGLSRLVDQAARNGDSAAQAILAKAADQLAGFALAIRRQLFVPGEIAKVAPIGGGFRSELLSGRFSSAVEASEDNQCTRPLHGPAAGALLEAYRIAGVAVTLSGAPEEKE